MNVNDANRMFSFGMLICSLLGVYTWMVILNCNEVKDVPVLIFWTFFVGFCSGTLLVKCIIEVLEK